MLFVPQKRAPESEGPCSGACDAVEVLPFSMFTPSPDVSDPLTFSPLPFQSAITVIFVFLHDMNHLHWLTLVSVVFYFCSWFFFLIYSSIFVLPHPFFFLCRVHMRL